MDRDHGADRHLLRPGAAYVGGADAPAQCSPGELCRDRRHRAARPGAALFWYALGGAAPAGADWREHRRDPGGLGLLGRGDRRSAQSRSRCERDVKRRSVRRRDILVSLGSAAAAWPLGARAQQAGKVYRVGVLTPSATQWSRSEDEAFRGTLDGLGY